MGAVLQSFIIYSAATAVVGGMVHSKGRELQKVAPFEFLFLYMPWLALLGMAIGFFGSVDFYVGRSGIWEAFWVLQTISAGIIGGFVLMPRYFIKADNASAKMLVNLVSGLAISLLFAHSRLLLFALSSPDYNSS
jgi:hypothetical protein